MDHIHLNKSSDLPDEHKSDDIERETLTEAKQPTRGENEHLRLEWET